MNETRRALDSGGRCVRLQAAAALIIQDDRYDGTASVTVLPLTTTAVDAPLLRVPVQPSATTFVHETSYVVIDKPTTVRRTAVEARVGRLPAAQLLTVERALLAFWA
jgi:mRNA interferase MazF